MSGHDCGVSGLDLVWKGGAEMRRNCEKKLQKVQRNIRLPKLHDPIWQVPKILS